MPGLLLIGQVLSHLLGISGYFEPVKLIREVPCSPGVNMSVTCGYSHRKLKPTDLSSVGPKGVADQPTYNICIEFHPPFNARVRLYFVIISQITSAEDFTTDSV